jgi:uncharacterized protein
MSLEPAVLDTNILVYALFQDSPHHENSRTLLELAGKPDANLFVCTQSLAEFYAIVTNPRRVTAARTTREAIAAVERFLALPGLTVLPQPVDIVPRWCRLLRQHPVTGPDVFDLLIVATMMAGGIHRLYTFNTHDFKPFSQIQLLTPAT